MIQEYFSREVLAEELQEKPNHNISAAQVLQIQHLPQQPQQQQQQFLNNTAVNNNDDEDYYDEDEFDFDFEDEYKAPAFKRDHHQQNQTRPIHMLFNSTASTTTSAKMASLPSITKPKIVFEDDETSSDTDEDNEERIAADLKNNNIILGQQASGNNRRAESSTVQQQQQQEKRSKHTTIFSSLVNAFHSMYGYVTSIFSNLFVSKPSEKEQAHQASSSVNIEETQSASFEHKDDNLLNVIVGGALFLITGFIFYASVKKFAPDLSNSFMGAISSIFVGGAARRTRSTFAVPKRM